MVSFQKYENLSFFQISKIITSTLMLNVILSLIITYNREMIIFYDRLGNLNKIFNLTFYMKCWGRPFKITPKFNWKWKPKSNRKWKHNSVGPLSSRSLTLSLSPSLPLSLSLSVLERDLLHTENCCSQFPHPYPSLKRVSQAE